MPVEWLAQSNSVSMLLLVSFHQRSRRCWRTRSAVGSPGTGAPAEGRGGGRSPRWERGDESWMLGFLLFQRPAERRWSRPRVHGSLSHPHATAAPPPSRLLVRKEGGLGAQLLLYQEREARLHCQHPAATSKSQITFI